MLLNEGEADFMPACEAARWRPGSHFYRVPALQACYATATTLLTEPQAAKR